jgi:hypothetical protein
MVSLRPMDQLCRDWEACSHGAASRHALHKLAAAEPLVATTADRAGALDLGDLVGALRRNAHRGRATSDGSGADQPSAVLQAMLRSQHVDPLVPRAILQALVPGLVGVARRLSWGAGGEWQDGAAFFGDLVTTAWEVITEWSGEDRDYAVLDVLSAVRCRLRRQLLRHRSRLDRMGAGTEHRVATACDWQGGTGLDDLARALDDVTGRGLEVSDASVLYAHRVLGYTMTELSKLTGRSRRYLGDRRDRAVQALTA